MAGMVKRNPINIRPKVLLVYPPYINKALLILGLIKHPVKKVSGLRKRKRALYWRTTRKH